MMINYEHDDSSNAVEGYIDAENTSMLPVSCSALVHDHSREQCTDLRNGLIVDQSPSVVFHASVKSLDS